MAPMKSAAMNIIPPHVITELPHPVEILESTLLNKAPNQNII